MAEPATKTLTITSNSLLGAVDPQNTEARPMFETSTDEQQNDVAAASARGPAREDGDEGYVDFIENEIQQGELAADARYLAAVDPDEVVR